MYDPDKDSLDENQLEPKSGEDVLDIRPNQNNEYNDSNEDVPYRAYMDATFQPRCQEPEMPKSYYTPPEEPKRQKKEGKSRTGFVGMVAACLVCSLLGGIGGGAIVAGQSSKDAASSGSNLSIAPENTSPLTADPVVAGEQLTGAQIYNLGCQQAVGITTEVTYKNFMGAEASSPVSGSGFIASSDGYIITNYHVIQDAYLGGYKVSVVLFNGETYEAKIIGGEEDKDIAVLKIEATGLSAATLGNSDNLQVGESIYAIGNPLGELSFSMSSGSVSALDREITTIDKTTQQTTTNNMFQIDAAVNSGNSGGPLYNDKGQVVGIVTAKYSDAGVEGLGFAIPINDIVSIVDDLIQNGYVSGKPSFGVTVNTVDASFAEYFGMVEGAYVYSVTPGSCSEKAGLAVGDIITALDDTEIKGTSDLTAAKKEYKAGDTVTMTVRRDGEDVKLTLTLDEEVPTKKVQEPTGKSYTERTPAA